MHSSSSYPFPSVGPLGTFRPCELPDACSSHTRNVARRHAGQGCGRLKRCARTPRSARLRRHHRRHAARPRDVTVGCPNFSHDVGVRICGRTLNARRRTSTGASELKDIDAAATQPAVAAERIEAGRLNCATVEQTAQPAHPGSIRQSMMASLVLLAPDLLAPRSSVAGSRLLEASTIPAGALHARPAGDAPIPPLWRASACR